MIQQLSPFIPIITPKGKALAIAIIDYGIEHDLHWICFQDNTGECWSWKNQQVRAQQNITHGRDHISPFYHPDSVALKKEKNTSEENVWEICDKCEEYKDECVCDSQKTDWEYKYSDLLEDYNKLEKTSNDILKENRNISKNLESLKKLIKGLITKDHIFPDSREEAKQKINETLDENEVRF